MSGTAITVIVIVAIVVIALVAFAAWRNRRSSALRGRFGPEYDRTIEDADSKRKAERDLQERAARREELNIVDLSPAAATRYQQQWMSVQQRFVDAPIPAVGEAQQLVTSVMRERGYPTSDADERESMLSVDHSDVMDRYRSATDIETRSRTGDATTEDLRQAMQHYRSLFDRLLGDATTGAAAGTTSTDATADTASYPAGTTGSRSSRGRDVVDVSEREDADRRL
jgi:FtsZ-interacting cell division protein ZipA